MEPIAGDNAMYNLDMSDDLLSPDSEEATTDKDGSGLLTALPTISTAQSMENVLLDTLPADESIDLGSESIVNQSVLSASSETAHLGEEALQAVDESSIATKPVSADNPSHVDGDGEIRIHFDDIVSPHKPAKELFAERLTDETSAVSHSDGDNSVAVHAPEIESDFDRIVKFGNEKQPESDDAREVEFLEEKGLKPAESSRSLCTFFENEDSVGGTDVEGKNFFDSFTTGDEEPIKPSSVAPSPKILEQAPALPPLAVPHVSLSSSLSSAAASPSPVHRISDSSPPFTTHAQSSATEGTTSDVDPFSAGVFTNEVDRRHNAWIPSESTRIVLVSVLTNAPGAQLPTHRTCSPHIVVEESLVCV